MTLNTNDFQPVFDDDFATDQSLNTTLWSDSWGYASQYSFANGALTLTSLQSQYFYPVGFMQATPGKSGGEGYGLYQFSGYANAGQGSGISFVMWRADNQWLDPTNPGTITEIDVLESWDGTVAGESTLHWYDPNAKMDDGYTSKQFIIDLTKPHTYAVDWERGSLTFYIDGNELYQNTTNVPLDAADGGSNEVMGAQIVYATASATSTSVQLHITDMSYSAPLAPGATPTPIPTQPAPTQPAPTQPPPVQPAPNPMTLGGGAQTYDAAAGATVQAGSGNDTITATAGLVSVTGGSGALEFIGGSGASTVSGGSGSATLFGGAGGGTYTGGLLGGNVLVAQGASGANTTLAGAAAGDRLFGSAADNDVLNAGPGGVSIVGGGSNTSITGGGSAASVIFSGAGPTTVNGGAAGGDTIVGSAGTLSVAARNGDAVFGNAGALNVTGSTAGNDSIVGGTGALAITGAGGNLLVAAGSGTSDINTGNGASLIFAGSGTATVTGGAGSMQVVLGSGTAVIDEGAGSTVYDLVNGSAGGAATLNGFRPGTDKIELFGYQQGAMQVVTGSASTLLNLSDGTKIQLTGVSDVGNSIIG